MKFLVILISVVAAYFWKQELDRINDNWFFSMRRKIETLLGAPGDDSRFRWLAIYLATFAVPLVVLTVLLWLSAGLLLGLITMLIHLFVLLMAFDRTQPRHLANTYRNLRDSGDREACREFLRQELEYVPEGDEGGAELHRIFNRLFVYRCFEKMFVMFFWYLLTGPLGVMVAYLCYQLRDGVFRLADPDASPGSLKEVQSVTALIGFLEWLPVRLLGLTLSLVGDFESCFRRLRRTGWLSEQGTEQTVYEYASCAVQSSTWAQPEAEAAQDGEESGSDGEAHRQDCELDALEALLMRSQVVWLVIIALITILGGFI